MFRHIIFAFFAVATASLTHISWKIFNDKSADLGIFDVCSCQAINPMSGEFDDAISNGVIISVIFRTIIVHCMYSHVREKTCTRPPPIWIMLRSLLVCFLDVGILASIALLAAQTFDKDRIISFVITYDYTMFAIKTHAVATLLNAVAFLVLFVRWIPIKDISDMDRESAIGRFVDKIAFCLLFGSLAFAALAAGSPTWDFVNQIGVFQKCNCAYLSDANLQILAERDPFEFIAVVWFMRYCIAFLYLFMVYMIFYPLVFARKPQAILRVSIALLLMVFLVSSTYAMSLFYMPNTHNGLAYYVFVACMVIGHATLIFELK